MGSLHGRLRALYGGQHGRITAVLATTSAAAGALTGFVGVGMAGAPVSHDAPTRATHVKAAKPHHVATTAPATALRQVRPTRTPTKSPTPSATPSMSATTGPAPTPTPTPSVSSTPTAPASSPPASDPASAQGSASPPG